MTLEQGALSGKYDSSNPFPSGSARAQIFNPLLDKLTVITDELKRIAKDHDASAAQIATAYAIAKGVVPILGVTKIYQVEEAVGTAEIVLSSGEVKALEDAADKSGVSSIQMWEQKME